MDIGATSLHQALVEIAPGQSAAILLGSLLLVLSQPLPLFIWGHALSYIAHKAILNAVSDPIDFLGFIRPI